MCFSKWHRMQRRCTTGIKPRLTTTGICPRWNMCIHWPPSVCASIPFRLRERVCLWLLWFNETVNKISLLSRGCKWLLKRAHLHNCGHASADVQSAPVNYESDQCHIRFVWFKQDGPKCLLKYSRSLRVTAIAWRGIVPKYQHFSADIKSFKPSSRGSGLNSAKKTLSIQPR